MHNSAEGWNEIQMTSPSDATRTEQFMTFIVPLCNLQLLLSKLIEMSISFSITALIVDKVDLF